MNALVARKAKLKLALSGRSCGRASVGAAKADKSIGEQRRDLAAALFRGHPIRWYLVYFMH